jgi:CshA-type fibril repeat protein
LLLGVAAFAYFGAVQRQSTETTSSGQSSDGSDASDKGRADRSDDKDSETESGDVAQDGIFAWLGLSKSRFGNSVSVADDFSTGQKGSVQIFDILANDTPRDGATFVLSSLELRLASNYVAGSTLSTDRKQVVAPNEGTYQAQSNGTVRFTPESTFVGTAVGVGYTVRDTNGVNYQGNYKPRVVDTAPVSCNDPRSQGFWLATKTGYIQGEEPSLTVKLQQLNASGVEMSVSSNGQRFFLVDDDGNALRSTDGGVNWQHVGPDIDEYDNLSYAASGNGMVILLSFEVGEDENEEPLYEHYRSTDGGGTWQPVDLPTPVADYYEDATLISESGDVMYQLDFGYSQGQVNVWRSTNMGVTWTALDPVDAFNPNSYAVSDDGTKLFISAYDPDTMAEPEADHLLIKSSDSGATWTQSDPTTEFIGYGELQVSGDGSKVLMKAYKFSNDDQPLYASTDGGSTWTERTGPGAGIRLNTIGLSNDGSRLIAAGDDSNNDYAPMYYASTDLGATWSSIAVPQVGPSLKRFVMVQDGAIIYALGYDATYLTTNFGSSWTVMAPIYQPFSEYRVDLNLSTAHSDYVLDKTATEGWKLTYDPVTDDLVATVTNQSLFVMPDEIITEYTLAPLAGCSNPIKGKLHFRYESLG